MLPSSWQVPPGGIGIYDTASEALVARFVPPGYSAGPFVFAPDSATAYIVSPNVISVYDTRTLQSTQTFNYATTFTALAISSDGATLYATDGTAIYVLDSATGALEQLFPLPPPYLTAAMALSPDGTTLFLINSHAVVYLIDTTSGQVRQVPVVATPSSIAVLP
jgi:streptogramin lyase